MADISVTKIDDARYRVEVSEGGGRTVHDVTADREQVERYGGGASGEALVEASFRFLLDREPKEAILRDFALPVIERYFGDYPRKIGSYLE
jgi:hypothetical protein